MFRRHFFLVIAVVLILVMGVAAGFKLLGKKDAGGPGGQPGAQASAGGQRQGGGAPGAAAGRGPGGAGGRGPTLVGGAPVTMRPFTDRVEVLGVAKGRESVTLTSNQAEIVTAVRFKPGQKVSRGQVLLDLKSDEEQAAIISATAIVAQAKADAERWGGLAERGFAPQATAEQYKVAYSTAQANLRAAQARLSDRVIRAPFSGTVGLSDIAPGALISPGTAIATLDDTSVMYVDFDVPDRFLPVIRQGMPIVARPDAYPTMQQGGVIARIDTRIDERTRAVKARAEFRNPDGKLKPGMLMRVGIDRGQRQSPAVPESAVQFSGDNSFVFVINPRAAQPGQGGAPGASQGGPQGAQPKAPQAAGAPPPGAPGGAAGQGQAPGQGRGRGAPPCSAILARAAAEGPGQPAAGGPSAKGAPAGNAPAGAGPAGGAGAAGGRRGGMGVPGSAEQRPVLAGLIEGGYVEIREGVKPGEIVVADGLNKLQNGMPVNWCSSPPQGGPAGAGGPGRGRGPGAPGAAGGRPDAIAPGASGRPGGQSGGMNPQGRPGGRVAGASN